MENPYPKTYSQSSANLQNLAQKKLPWVRTLQISFRKIGSRVPLDVPVAASSAGR